MVVASQNPDKIAEVVAVLETLSVPVEPVPGLTWPEVEETADTLEGNALLKARTVAAVTGLPALGDDTGLEVAALDGRPGVHTARYAGPTATYGENVARLLDEMDGVVDRSARFRTVVALVRPGRPELVAEGALDGRIGVEPRGRRGFGYDPVFMVDGHSLAELSPEDKDRISHRARALRALAELLAAGN